MAKKYANALLGKPVIKDKSLMHYEKIKKNITVLPELENLIPPLKEEESNQLEQNILKEGCREALLVWQQEEGKYILIDGHNRYRICSKHKKDFKVTLVHFPNLQEVKDYMIENQLGRRNLTPEQTSYLRGMRYNLEKMDKGKYDRKQKAQNGSFAQKPTSERLAEEYKVSKNTIKRDAEYAEGLEKIGESNQALKKEILGGKVKVKKSDVQTIAKVEHLGEIQTSEDISKAAKKKTTPKRGGRKKVEPKGDQPKTKSLEESKQRVIELTQKIEKTPDILTIYNELVEEVMHLKTML